MFPFHGSMLKMERRGGLVLRSFSFLFRKWSCSAKIHPGQSKELMKPDSPVFFHTSSCKPDWKYLEYWLVLFSFIVSKYFCYVWTLPREKSSGFLTALNKPTFWKPVELIACYLGFLPQIKCTWKLGLL